MAAVAGHHASSSAAAAAVSSSCALQSFKYRRNWRYLSLFRKARLQDFISMNCEVRTARCLAMTYKHADSDITVTLCPVVHVAHPIFFAAVDELCCQHESVLCEGRSPLANAPYSTVVPARDLRASVRPLGVEPNEPWEPLEASEFRQPFSWGVNESPKNTVVHAADAFEPDRYPLWFRIRYQLPFIGGYVREKHCLNMIPPLAANGYKSFIIPWGAAHMPLFATMLEDNGFEQVGMIGIMAVNYYDGPVSRSVFHRIDYQLRALVAIDETLNLLAAVFATATVLWIIGVRQYANDETQN